MAVSNKAIAEAFRNAVPKLWDGKERALKTAYICVAIRRGNPNYNTENLWDDDPPDVEAARMIVRVRITGFYTLENWLQDKCGIPIDDTLQSKRMQAYRHTWLKQLIKEFETKK